MEKSAVPEHVWENHHPIHHSPGQWQRTGAVCEGHTHANDTLKECLNQDGELEA